MNYEEISKTKQFQELLEQIPNLEREKIKQAIRSMVEDFNNKVIRPLENIVKK